MTTLGSFDGFGIELEFMVVDAQTLATKPVVDRILRTLAGEDAMEVEIGPVAWSNELALHVIEAKTNGPAPDLDGAARDLFHAVAELEPILAEHGARLMPGGMHPFMDPEREFRLWPTDEERIYETFDRIFDCRGHGWSNLQSMHVNLPFASDEEFARLHEAVRLLLPILPALSASTPFKDGKRAACLDERLAVYRTNAAKVLDVTGHVVPERATSQAQYEREILKPIYDALSPLDPEGILQHEWVNSRGAIARFDRMAIEIRVLDAQESVRANLALAHCVVEVLRVLVETSDRRPAYPGTESELDVVLRSVMRDAEQARVADAPYLSALGSQLVASSAGALWRELLDRVAPARKSATLWPLVESILERRCLARRILSASGPEPSRSELRRVYARLCDCLDRDEAFVA